VKSPGFKPQYHQKKEGGKERAKKEGRGKEGGRKEGKKEGREGGRNLSALLNSLPLSQIKPCPPLTGTTAIASFAVFEQPIFST
jgi:hypothetical protein